MKVKPWFIEELLHLLTEANFSTDAGRLFISFPFACLAQFNGIFIQGSVENWPLKQTTKWALNNKHSMY